MRMDHTGQFIRSGLGVLIRSYRTSRSSIIQPILFITLSQQFEGNLRRLEMIYNSDLLSTLFIRQKCLLKKNGRWLILVTSPLCCLTHVDTDLLLVGDIVKTRPCYLLLIICLLVHNTCWIIHTQPGFKESGYRHLVPVDVHATINYLHNECNGVLVLATGILPDSMSALCNLAGVPSDNSEKLQ